jgi:hypothetical protein
MYNNIMPTMESLLNRIYDYESYIEKIDKITFEPFLKSIVNGDTLLEYLVFPATIGKDKQGILVYILTNAKLVKITVDSKEFSSNSAFLNQVVRVDKTVNKVVTEDDGDKNNVLLSVEFPQGRFGLRYPSDDKVIDNFFVKVEESVRNARISK